MNLTASERIILHVAEHWKATAAMLELTQKGIASGADILRSHVPRNLKRLISEGCIETAEGRVDGRGRKVNYYRITEAGLRRGRELRESVLEERILYEGKEATVGEISKRFALSPLAIVLGTDSSGVFRAPVVALQQLSGLIERDEDMASLKKWAREGGPVMVVYGASGMGKTALGRAFIAQHRGPHAWIDLQDADGLERVLSGLAQALHLTPPENELKKALIEHIKSNGTLVVLDGYHNVSEDVVDFLAGAIGDLRDSGGRLLVLAQETTPSYCRFYGRGAVSKGDVWERHLKGLTLDGCKKMLGAEQIDSEALKRIFLLTKGTPLYLDLIRRGDADGLKRRSRFTSAETKLLMFSRDVSSRH